jgi:hypothetical protein
MGIIMKQEDIDKINEERNNTKRNNIYNYIIKEVAGLCGKITLKTLNEELGILEWELNEVFNENDIKEFGKEHDLLIKATKELIDITKMERTDPEIIIDSIQDLNKFKN